MKKFKEVKLEMNINTSKELVWDLLFNRFGEVNNFNPLIEGSHHTAGVQGEVGCERQCDLDARNSVQEKIVAARGNDSFDIEVIEGGLPVMDEMKATFDLEALGTNRTRVNLTMNYTTRPTFVAQSMKSMMAKMLYKMLVGLKYHLETGNLVTKENIKSILNEYKQLQPHEGYTAKLALANAS